MRRQFLTPWTAVLLGFILACSEEEEARPDPTAATGAGGAPPSTTGSNVGGGNEGGGNEGGGNEGGGNTQALGYENGSRLRARVYAGTDGAKQFLGWRDTQLGVDCAFGRVADGTTRCIPVTSASYGFDPDVTPTLGYFSDSGCTQQVALAPCTETSGYAFHYDNSACPPFVAEIATVGAPTGAQFVYAKAGINCYSTAVPAGNVVLPVTGQVPPSTFVEASIQVE